MSLHVYCYAGRKANERPIRFELDGNPYFVEEITDQWHGPSATFFKIRADDGNLYTLSHQSILPEGEWRLESVKQFRIGPDC